MHVKVYVYCQPPLLISHIICVNTNAEIAKFNHFLVKIKNLLKFHQVCDYCCVNTHVGVLC